MEKVAIRVPVDEKGEWLATVEETTGSSENRYGEISNNLLHRRTRSSRPPANL